MTDLVASNLTVAAGASVLVENASFRLSPGELVALLGPNGAGKTSLLRASLGFEKLANGSAKLGDIDCALLPPAQRARRVSYLPQSRPLSWPNLVRDVVALGRFSHGAQIGRMKDDDAAAVERAFVACDILHLAGRKTDTLSGGELARVHCARAFAAETPLLVADEPVAALDPRHQFRIMDLVKAYVERGGGALVILHDIGLAARYADRLIWMKSGRLLDDGSPGETLTAERLMAVYGVEAQVSGTSVVMKGAA